MSSYIEFKKVGVVTPFVQILTMVLLFVLTAIIGKLYLVETGSLFGRPTSFYLETMFAPIYEEIIFRGLVFGLLLKNHSLLKAIVYSSLLFGLWHLKNIFFMEPLELIRQMIYTGLIFGPLMAWITFKTKTIWIAAILHYVNNGVVFLMMYQAIN